MTTALQVVSYALPFRVGYLLTHQLAMKLVIIYSYKMYVAK